MGRFLRLERARPDLEGGDVQSPQTSGRFSAIEPRRDQPEPSEPDPFEPPPEPELHLDVVDEHPIDRANREAARKAKASALLDELEADKMLAALKAEEHQWDFGALGRLKTGERVLILAGLVLVCAVVGELWHPLVWMAVPIALAVLVASAFGKRAT
ncbi:MAG: hypothetical protein ABI867_33170 [Kofleriaceae bacterium]